MAIAEYDLGYAIVRIHHNNKPEAERRKLLEAACKDFYKAIRKEHPDFFEKQKKEGAVNVLHR
jgi:hypothetical protein